MDNHRHTARIFARRLGLILASAFALLLTCGGYYLWSTEQERKTFSRCVYTVSQAKEVGCYIMQIVDEWQSLDRYPEEKDRGREHIPRYVLPKPYRDTTNPRVRIFITQVEGQNFFADMFATKGTRKAHLFQYLAAADWFLIAGCGPDGEFSQEWYDRLHRDKANLPFPQVVESAAPILYDPTNGTSSQGDIVLLWGTDRKETLWHGY